MVIIVNIIKIGATSVMFIIKHFDIQQIKDNRGTYPEYRGIQEVMVLNTGTIVL